VRFRVEQHLPGDVHEVLDALLDPSFVAALGASPRIDAPALLDVVREGDRVVQRVRYRFAGDLSSAVTAVIDRSKLTWVTETTYDLAAGSATFRVLPDHYADRLRCTGTHRYAQGDGETERLIEGDLQVRYPIVGRALERAVLSGLEEHLAAECDLLETFLTDG
jgi:hypothetical protein